MSEKKTTACTIWEGATDARGNPKIGQMSGRRVLWLLSEREIPSGGIVRRCPASPLCVNLDHLSVEQRIGGSAGPARVFEDPVQLRCTIDRWAMDLLLLEEKRVTSEKPAGAAKRGVVGKIVGEAITAALGESLSRHLPASGR